MWVMEVWEVHVKAQCWYFPLLFSVLLVQGLLCRQLGSTGGLLPPAKRETFSRKKTNQTKTKKVPPN